MLPLHQSYNNMISMPPQRFRRLLQQGAEEAAWVVSPGLPHISTFSEVQSPEVRDRIFEDFNSLAVVYRMPASSFGQVRACRVLNHCLARLFRSSFFAKSESMCRSFEKGTLIGD